MIVRLKTVITGKLYRGGALSIEDVIFLNRKLGIKKIISLDKAAGEHIKKACKLLGINQVMLPIDINSKATIINFLKQDLEKLLLEDGPTFIGCSLGKDRTGMAIAIFRCKFQDWDCKNAIKEAHKMGFGLGLPVHIKQLFLHIIKSACKCADTQEDNNYAYDITEGARQDAYNDYYGSASENLSWAPYSDYRVREFPFAPVEIRNYQEPYQNRQDYDLDTTNTYPAGGDVDMPSSGSFDGEIQGINGLGPGSLAGGFV